MPYSIFSTPELLEKLEQEKNFVLEMLIRQPNLSKESIEKLSEKVKLIDAELKKRGEMGL